MKKIVLTDKQVVADLLDFIAHECDADELAGIYGQVFGFSVSTEDGKTYDCVPNADYCDHRKEELKG